MDVPRLIEGLSRPEAYPYDVDRIEVRQTHISLVFLAGPYVYKLRKPVKLGFLDFSTLESRRRDCFEEVRLNRRLADDVYVGVTPVAVGPDGAAFEREGEPIDWAVKMKRLPDEASLLAMLGRGELDGATLDAVARRVAAFHRAAGAPASGSVLGGVATVAENARDNLVAMERDVGTTVSAAVHGALRERTEASLARLSPLVEKRARSGVPREGHGDLRLEHIYLLADRDPPADLAIIDCVEFDERFRVGDPIGDIAFTAMELSFHGRDDLARSLVDSYVRWAGDDEGKVLVPFYVAYRSLVRAKVRGIELREKEIPEDRRASSLAKAKAHALLALGELESAGRRPVLVLVGGLPGTGKSTLARGLAAQAACEVIRSDLVRKELAAPPGELYARAWKLRAYDECKNRALQALFEGKRVVVDATFAEVDLRRSFVDAARSLSVPVVWIVCQAPAETVRSRLALRRGDASDADWAVYEDIRRTWEPDEEACRRVRVDIDTEPGPEHATARALSELRIRGLSD